jgi:hypothetical protein
MSSNPTPPPNPTANPSTPEPHPHLSQPPAAAGEQRPAPVWIKPEEWQAHQAELAELRAFRAESERQAAAVRDAELRAQAAKGQAEAAIDEITKGFEVRLQTEREARMQTEKAWLSKEKGAAIAEALAGVRFAGPDPQETAKLVRRLLEDDVEAVLGTQGNPVVRDRQTLRPAVDVLREKLASPQFAIFLDANTRGGTGSDGARLPATPTNADPYEEFARQFRDRNKRSIYGPVAG